jgi:hypothetical protein
MWKLKIIGHGAYLKKIPELNNMEIVIGDYNCYTALGPGIM